MLRVFGEAGAGVFPAPSVLEKELQRRYGFRRIGRTGAVRSRFYAISAERRLKHPAVAAIYETARRKLFR